MASSEVVAGPALGLPSLQMTYAVGRSSRQGKQGPEEPAQAAAERPAGWEAGSPLAPADDEAAQPLPPQPPIILPASAAAVRVKEQQLRGQQGVHEEEEGEELAAAADAAVAAEQQQQGPGLLQKAVEATSSAAQAAVGLAGQAYAAAVPAVLSAVGKAPGEAAEEEADAVPASSQEGPVAAGAGSGSQPAALGDTGAPPRRPDVPSPPERAAAAAAAAAAARPDPATAPLLPASAGTPAATAHGYFPTAGVVAPPPKPSSRQSGTLEARKVEAQRIGALEARAPNHAPSTPGQGSAGAAARRAAGMDEDWISELVERLWPYIKAAVEKMAWQMLPDILEASEPSWIHDINLKKFVLGDREPDISDIRVWMDDNDVMEDCFLEFAFEWHSQQDIELEIQVLPGSMDKAWLPNFIENKLKDLLTFSVGVEDAKLRGRLRVTLRPLLRRVPVVGAVQVSLVEQPEFDFDLTLGNNTNVPMEPALKSWIKQTVQDSVFQAYVLPEHYFLQIDPEAQDLESPTGVLVVEVVEAKRVPRMDFLTRSSPFVELYVRNSQRRTTSIKRPTKHPRWGETFELPVHVPENQELCMVLYDYDWASANDEIGRAQLKISDLQPGQQADLWLDVTSESQEELAEQKKDMSKRERAKVAAAKPLMKQSNKGCQLHIQATYIAFSDAEEKLIKEGQRSGLRRMLDSPQGRQINQHLRSLLQSGTLHVRVPRAEALPVSSLIGRPSVKGVVRCGRQEKQLTAVKASRHGCVQFDQAVQLDLGPEATNDARAAVTVELQEGGWFGGDAVGLVHVPLQDVIKRRRLQDSFQLEGSSGGRGRVEVEVEWKPYF